MLNLRLRPYHDSPVVPSPELKFNVLRSHKVPRRIFSSFAVSPPARQFLGSSIGLAVGCSDEGASVCPRAAFHLGGREIQN